MVKDMPIKLPDTDICAEHGRIHCTCDLYNTGHVHRIAMNYFVNCSCKNCRILHEFWKILHSSCCQVLDEQFELLDYKKP